MLPVLEPHWTFTVFKSMDSVKMKPQYFSIKSHYDIQMQNHDPNQRCQKMMTVIALVSLWLSLH